MQVFKASFLFFLISFFGAFQAAELQAQFWYSDGFVVSYDNDTMFGKIRAATPAIRSVRIVFIPDGSRERVRFQPFQIKGFSINGMYYESAIYDIDPTLNYGYAVFMELLNDPHAYVKLYKYYNTDRDRGFFQTFLSREGYQMYRVPSRRFGENLAWFFSDYPELSEDLEEGSFKKQDLPEIVEHYNRWRAGDISPSENGTYAPWRGSK